MKDMKDNNQIDQVEDNNQIDQVEDNNQVDNQVEDNNQVDNQVEYNNQVEDNTQIDSICHSFSRHLSADIISLTNESCMVSKTRTLGVCLNVDELEKSQLSESIWFYYQIKHKNGNEQYLNLGNIPVIEEEIDTIVELLEKLGINTVIMRDSWITNPQIYHLHLSNNDHPQIFGLKLSNILSLLNF